MEVCVLSTAMRFVGVPFSTGKQPLEQVGSLLPTWPASHQSVAGCCADSFSNTLDNICRIRPICNPLQIAVDQIHPCCKQETHLQQCCSQRAVAFLRVGARRYELKGFASDPWCHQAASYLRRLSRGMGGMAPVRWLLLRWRWLKRSNAGIRGMGPVSI